VTNQLTALEDVFKALADTTRLRILGLLLTGEVCVCHIHETLKIPQPKASRHLAYLRRSGLVETRRNGLWVYYRLSTSADPILGSVQQVVTHVLQHLDVVQKDGDRLHKKTGCCKPASVDVPMLACCGGSAGAGRASNGRTGDAVS
jgi:ArsR family transcriptional regulator